VRGVGRGKEYLLSATLWVGVRVATLVVMGVASAAVAKKDGEPMDATPPSLSVTDVKCKLTVLDTAAVAGAASR
jgi:hypothetical protein